VPDVHAAELKYSERKGIFVKAIEAAVYGNLKLGQMAH